MKAIASVILSLCALILSAQAAPLDEHHRLAVELVELISTNRPSDGVFSQQVADKIDGVIPQLKLKAKDEELFRKAALEVVEAVTMERLIEMLANAYAKRLSVKELEGIVAFYKTDAGKAWLRESGAIELEKQVEKKALIAEVLKDIKQRFEDLKKLDPK